MPWALSGVSIYRLGYVFLALAPWIHFSFLTPAIFYVGLIILLPMSLQFFSIGNVGMIIELVPENRRATVFTIRNMTGAMVTICGVFLAGQWLSHREFPGNYQILFVVIGILAFFDIFAWLNLRFPERSKTKLEESPKKFSINNQMDEIGQVFRDRPVFARFIINYTLLNTGLWMVGPLYVLYTVRHLLASDAWIGTSGTIATACSLVGWLVGRRLVELWGDSVTARRMALLLGFYPILVGLTSSLNLILVLGGLYNLITPGFSLGINNLYLRVLPKERREDAVGIYITIMNIGPFIFPLVGVTLAGLIGFPATIILCGVMVILGSISFWIWRIKVD